MTIVVFGPPQSSFSTIAATSALARSSETSSTMLPRGSRTSTSLATTLSNVDVVEVTDGHLAPEQIAEQLRQSPRRQPPPRGHVQMQQQASHRAGDEHHREPQRCQCPAEEPEEAARAGATRHQNASPSAMLIAIGSPNVVPGVPSLRVPLMTCRPGRRHPTSKRSGPTGVV